MSPDACPSEADLLAAADDESAGADLAAHMAACPACRERLAGLRRDNQTLSWIAERPAATGGSGMPTSLGKYLVVGRLGTNAACESYRALHAMVRAETRVDWARTALPAADDRRQALRTAAARLSEIVHPALARIRDFDFADDRPFVASEFRRGLRLSLALEAGPFAPGIAAGVAAQLGSALLALVEQALAPMPPLTLCGVYVDEDADLGAEGGVKVVAAWLSDWAAPALFGASAATPSIDAAAAPDAHVAIDRQADRNSAGELARLFVCLVCPQRPERLVDLTTEMAHAEIDRMLARRSVSPALATQLRDSLQTPAPSPSGTLDRLTSALAAECAPRGMARWLSHVKTLWPSQGE